MCKKLIVFISVIGCLFAGQETSSAFRPVRPFKFDVSVNAVAGAPNQLETFFTNQYDEDYFYGNPTVKDFYSEKMGTVRFHGLYSVKFEYHPWKRISFGGDFSYGGMSGDAYYGFDSKNTTTKWGHAFYILPEVRFYYYLTKTTQLSGAFMGGVGLYSGMDRTCSGAWQIIPVSFTIGGKLYGKAELTFGSIINGVNFGVGYRF